MKNKFLKYAIAPAIGLGVLGGSAYAAQAFMPGAVSPQQVVSFQQRMFSRQAQVLGVSEDDVKNAWASGKTLADIAAEKGITKDQLRTKMQELHKQQAADHLKALVDAGVITQAQADRRLETIQKMDDRGGKRGHMGMMRGMGM